MVPSIYSRKKLTSYLTLASVFSFLFSLQVFAFPIIVSDSPNSDLDLTLSAIRSAKESIYLNAYEFTSPEVKGALLDKINEGIHVEILQEGEPVGGLSATARQIEDDLSHAMKKHNSKDHYYEMSKRAGGERRFHFDHAKYAVIDEKSLLIGSENYSPSGHPQENRKGNRGWEVFIQQVEIAKTFKTLFKNDTQLSSGDLIDLTAHGRSEEFTNFWNVFNPIYDENLNFISDEVRTSPLKYEATEVYQITSPETSRSGIISLLDHAKSNIDLELMTFDSNWGGTGQESPLYHAVVEAARRGVKIRVLLNDERAFMHTEPTRVTKNQQTVKLLNGLANKKHLDIQARVADVKAMKVTYIHNKGALVDQDKTLISSINWNENSVEHNREAAVVVVSKPVHSYYLKLFEKDWNASAGEAEEGDLE